jgi:hypothetical protein
MILHGGICEEHRTVSETVQSLTDSISQRLLSKEPDVLESVIPECFYRWFDLGSPQAETGTGSE